MSDYNYSSIAATSSEASAASTTTTVAGITGKRIAVMGFDGSSSDQPFAVALAFGGTDQLVMQGSSDTSVGRQFDANSPLVAGLGEAVTVTTTPAANGQCNANIVYRIQF